MDSIGSITETVTLIILCLVAFGSPVAVSIANIYGLIEPKIRWKKLFWIATVVLGVILSGLYLAIWRVELTDKAWNEQLINDQVHEIMNGQYEDLYFVLLLIGAAGFLILSVCKMQKTPPLISVLAIAAMYPAAVTLVIWCMQISAQNMSFPLMVLPANLLIMMCSLIREKIMEWNEEREKRIWYGQSVEIHQGWYDGILGKAQYWPLFALIAAIPLLGIVLGVSILCGQRPDALIAAWTETADWTFSQMIPPPNVQEDEHYLCTVAAGGHAKVVKPLRMGERHGHRVVVNRQLEIANAFELVLEWKTPKLHRVIRNFYDKYGFPIARCIRTKTACDVVYVIMKPLEWFFTIVLYLTLVHPENVIAVQYLPGYRDVLASFSEN